jgi:hypothetical protein
VIDGPKEGEEEVKKEEKPIPKYKMVKVLMETMEIENEIEFEIPRKCKYLSI